LARSVAPDQIDWQIAGGSGSLFAEDVAQSTEPPAASAPFTVPAAFLALAAQVALHRDPARFALLYRVLWRVRADRRVLDMTMDPDIVRATAMEKSVRRDVHKMKAFIRFREVNLSDRKVYIAWFEPEHHIVEHTAPFFLRRYPNMHWSILTPEVSAHWNLQELSFGPGAHRTDAPREDAHEQLWQTYYSSIFNPARLNVAAMRAHMPQKYWRNLPESGLIPALIADAQQRTRDMIHKQPTEPSRAKPRATRPARTRPTPNDRSLSAVREQAEHCRDCPLWKNATQTVFGEGAVSAKIVFVGEQPGDQEDIAGRPFVGPAGRLLDRALQAAGVDRTTTYVTNAVKHFKFEPRGKRRIHKKPNELEIAACNQWLERELRLIKPDLVVALGATAARAIFGRATAIEKNRGHVIRATQTQTGYEADILVTVHPSYLLRVPDEDRDAAFEKFVGDLKLARKYA
jgi:uracil-DNA glycosylase